MFLYKKNNWIKLCLSAIIGGSIVYGDEGLTTSGGSSGSHSHESTASCKHFRHTPSNMTDKKQG